MTISETTVRREVFVDATVEWAFEVFTARIGTWWPADYHIGEAQIADVFLEPRVGGRCYEVGTDGKECDWGQVLTWEPPRRLVVAWQLNSRFQYDPDLSHASEYEVTFVEQSPGRTKVELEHRGFGRHGTDADDVQRGVGGEQGWSFILPRYEQAVTSSR
jgi:uncharacterized protein YndB with AHSA1/START domain